MPRLHDTAQKRQAAKGGHTQRVGSTIRHINRKAGLYALEPVAGDRTEQRTLSADTVIAALFGDASVPSQIVDAAHGIVGSITDGGVSSYDDARDTAVSKLRRTARNRGVLTCDVPTKKVDVLNSVGAPDIGLRASDYVTFDGRGRIAPKDGFRIAVSDDGKPISARTVNRHTGETVVFYALQAYGRNADDLVGFLGISTMPGTPAEVTLHDTLPLA